MNKIQEKKRQILYHTHHNSKFFLFTLMLILVSLHLSAQVSISGVVTDPLGNPIPELEVGLFIDNGDSSANFDSSLVAWTMTDSNGHYVIEEIPAGTYRTCFNFHYKDTMHQTMSVVNIELSKHDFLLDVSVQMRENVAYCYVIQSPSNWKKISGKVTGLPVYRKAKIIFEVIETGEKHVVYTDRDGNFIGEFPPKTGPVKVHVFSHEGKNEWQEIESYVQRPQRHR